jgi:hypothetical protein
MGVLVKPNNKCSNCKNYVDQHGIVNSVPRFCGKRYEPLEPGNL